MEFVAIDFETANSNPNSACQLAAVVVRDSKIAEEHSWLIRPPRTYFSPHNIAIHGIRPQDVAKSPTMEQVWSRLQQVIDGQVLIAHNARFDLGVLVHSLSAFDIACPFVEFTCTRLLARQAWPGRSKYGLKPLGDWLGVEFQHHDALEDARCCAQIALAVAKSIGAPDLNALESALRITRGSHAQGHTKSPRTKGRSGKSAATGGRVVADRWGFPSQVARNIRRIDSTTVLAAAHTRPLDKKNIVMLGPLGGMDLEETKQLLTALGANFQTQIDADTDYVVACGATLESASQLVCRSVETAEVDASQKGKIAGIRLLSERQFRALLPAGKASSRW